MQIRVGGGGGDSAPRSTEAKDNVPGAAGPKSVVSHCPSSVCGVEVLGGGGVRHTHTHTRPPWALHTATLPPHLQHVIRRATVQEPPPAVGTECGGCAARTHRLRRVVCTVATIRGQTPAGRSLTGRGKTVFLDTVFPKKPAGTPCVGSGW